jgi:deoxyribose-phosphate aldolase
MTASLSPFPAGLDQAVDSFGFDVDRFAANALHDQNNLAAVLDSTLLQPTTTSGGVLRACEEAARYRFACVMVNPCWIALAHSALAGTGIPVGSVVGFPLGASLTRSKREEAEAAIRLGAHELDMVLHIGALKERMNEIVRGDIDAVCQVAHGSGVKLKVILETCLLTLEEKLRASEICVAAGVDFLKTSTGFSIGGATAADVSLLRGVAGGLCGVKAAGGIRTLDAAEEMLRAGANRIGTSSAVAIMESFGERSASR